MLKALHASVLLTYTGIALCIQLIRRTITVPCTDIWYCVYMQLIGRIITVPMYLHLILRLHAADMADYHCAHVLTSGIAFTCSWYGGISLCPCTYIWYCVWYGGLPLCPVLTSDIAFTCSWYGGLSLCPVLTSGIAFTCSWYGGLTLCPVLTSGIAFTCSWYGGLSLCPVLTSDIAFTCIWYGGLSLCPVLTSDIAFTCNWYGGLSLCPVLTSYIAFTCSWYDGLSLCPCTYIWYCVYMQVIWRTITVAVYLLVVLLCTCIGRPRTQLLLLFYILQLQSAHFSLPRV